RRGWTGPRPVPGRVPHERRRARLPLVLRLRRRRRRGRPRQRPLQPPVRQVLNWQGGSPATPMPTERSGRWGAYREASPPPARPRAGTRSARRLHAHWGPYSVHRLPDLVNGVQEVAGSNPVAPITRRHSSGMMNVAFFAPFLALLYFFSRLSERR